MAKNFQFINFQDTSKKLECPSHAALSCMRTAYCLSLITRLLTVVVQSIKYLPSQLLFFPFGKNVKTLNCLSFPFDLHLLSACTFSFSFLCVKFPEMLLSFFLDIFSAFRCCNFNHKLIL